MYDFWFTLGSAIIHPEFLDAVGKTAQPNFNRIMRVTVESTLVPTPETTETFMEAISAGKLDSAGTPKFRVALQQQLVALSRKGKNPPPPPTSVYAAGRLSQLLTIEPLGFGGPNGHLAEAQRAFKNAVDQTPGANPAEFSNTFPAFIGLCLIDGGLRSLLEDAAPAAIAGDAATPTRALTNVSRSDGQIVDDLGEILAEFGISSDPRSPERQVISNFLAGSEDIIALMMRADGNPWDVACADWLVYWSPQSDRAVI